MKYSILFLEYDPQGINRSTTIESLQSIIEHSKNYDFELIHVKNVKGYVKAVNEGLKRSKGDYIIQVANDVLIQDFEWLTKFTIEDKLIGWRLTPFFINGKIRPDFACWGMSRQVFNKIGLMDETYSDGYGFDDDDYVFTAREMGIDVHDAKVNLKHLECLTYRTVFKANKEEMTSRNESLFRTKWNDKLKSAS